MSRVCDFTGPSAVYGARLLAELGHDVIRVEPVDPDTVRRMGPHLQGVPVPENGPFHQFFNAGKRSVAIDPASSASGEAVLALLRSADVVLCHAPVPFDEVEVRRECPGLQVVVVTDDLDSELCALAESGLLALVGAPGEEPVRMGFGAAYATVGMMVAIAAVAGTLGTSDAGERVDLSVQAVLAGLGEQSVLAQVCEGETVKRMGGQGAVLGVSGAFEARDGRWLLSVPASRAAWEALVGWMDDDELNARPELADEAKRAAARPFIRERLNKWSADLTVDEAVHGAQERGLPASPISPLTDLLTSDQLIERGFIKPQEHPLLGTVPLPTGALATTFGVELNRAPFLGEHTHEVLAELGYPDGVTG